MSNKHFIHTLLISLFIWTDTLSQDFDAVALFEKGQISERVWWEGSHADRYLLIKPVKLQKCLDDKNTLHTPTHKLPSYSSGIWIHPRGIRKDSWHRIFGQELPKPFEHSVGLSIVPYVESAGKKLMIVPYIENDGHFKTYYPVCEAEMNEHFYSYPHYYPTMMLKPISEESAEQKELLDKLLKAVKNQQSLELAISSDSFNENQIRLEALLKKSLSSVDNMTVFLNKLQIPFEIEIQFEGFEKLEPWQYQPPQEPTTIAVQWGNTIPYDENYVIYQYPDKATCRTGKNPILLKRYTEANLQGVKIKPDAYFKLYDGPNDEPASRCAMPKNQENQWVIDFKPYKCGVKRQVKRQLIVIATGKKLDSYGGRLIPKTIAKVLKNHLETRKPFTLVTIQNGRALSEPLLQCEELADLETDEMEQLIRRRVQNIRFGATDLRAFADLDFVNLVYPSEKLHSVFYITDNNGIPTNLDRINDKHLSVPVITWKRAKIKLTVLAAGSCRPWMERADAHYCEEIDSQKVGTQIQEILGKFLENMESIQ